MKPLIKEKVKLFVIYNIFLLVLLFVYPPSRNYINTKLINQINKFTYTKTIDKTVDYKTVDYKKFIQEQREKLAIQRFKGLGEMNPEELWETTLNPDNRTMLRVQYSKETKEKSKEDQKMIKVLMGDEVAPRKEFITNNALDVANLDI